MRLEIHCIHPNLVLPINYSHELQECLYRLIQQDIISNFYHNVGFSKGGKTYKLFTFSRLMGNYTLVNQQLCFKGKLILKVGSYDPLLLIQIMNTIIKKGTIVIKNQEVKVNELNLVPSLHFKGKRKVILKTISPCIICSTIGRKRVYYPWDKPIYKELLIKNLKAKYLQISGEELDLSAVQIKKGKKVLVHYKSEFYEATQFEMEAICNDEALNLMLDCGLGAKNSVGFGMVELMGFLN